VKTNPSIFIYPPRPEQCLPRDQTDFLGEMGWLAQLKYNDSHLLVKYSNSQIELWNRHGQRLNYTCPDWLQEQLQVLRVELGLAENGYHLLDGGLLDSRHRAIKDTIVIWDILVRNGEHLLGSTYQERYNNIAQKAEIPWHFNNHKFGLTWGKSTTPNIFIPENWPHQTWSDLWNLITEVNAPYTIGNPSDPNYKISPLLEGLVIKNPLGELGMGFTEKNNASWIMRSRITTGRHYF